MLRQAIPFVPVTNIQRSVAFYDALGFNIVNRWDPDGELRWCRLELDGVALMLQTASAEISAQGISISFACDDALAIHRDAVARGLSPVEPFVGNGLCVTGFRDPDGYRVEFASPTNVAEDTTLAEFSAS